MKPCFCCKKPSSLLHGDKFFDANDVFKQWVANNRVICAWRSRFEGVKARLEWAALDENDDGVHAECALHWAINKEGFGTRYPIVELRT